MQTTQDKADTSKARLYRADGLVDHFDDQKLAYRVWLAAPKGTRLAFRGAGDERPVYPHDLVDVQSFPHAGAGKQTRPGKRTGRRRHGF
jgi:hypothetical protein